MRSQTERSAWRSRRYVAWLSPPGVYAPRDPTGTPLYGLVAEQRATFAAATSAEGGAPSFVNDAFERFLRCGVLACGFARFQCTTCQHEHFVGLSCKARGLCPSCGGRRMMSITRHVIDAVLPHVPLRQWVLSLPHALRYRVAYDQELCTALHRILAATLRKRLQEGAHLLEGEAFVGPAVRPFGRTPRAIAQKAHCDALRRSR